MATAHLNALETKHAELENQIAMEEARPAPDDVKLHTLKRQKLRLKDEIMVQATRH